MKRVYSEGGLLIYMICDGRGAGLFTKVSGLALGDTENLDTYDAYEKLGSEKDPREYTRVANVVKFFGLDHVQLMTNNPRKVQGLEECGFTVTRVELEIPPTPDSFPYLATKKNKGGHMIEAKKPDESD